MPTTAPAARAALVRTASVVRAMPASNSPAIRSAIAFVKAKPGNRGTIPAITIARCSTLEKNKHQIFIDTQNIEERYAEGLYQDYLEEENKKHKTQQKEFIDYLENEIKERKIQILGYHPTTQLLIEQIIETEKMVLSKYKSIIGDIDENN